MDLHSFISLFAPRVNTWVLLGWGDLCAWDAEERSFDWPLFVVSRVLYSTGKSNHSCCMKDCRRKEQGDPGKCRLKVWGWLTGLLLQVKPGQSENIQTLQSSLVLTIFLLKVPLSLNESRISFLSLVIRSLFVLSTHIPGNPTDNSSQTQPRLARSSLQQRTCCWQESHHCESHNHQLCWFCAPQMMRAQTN